MESPDLSNLTEAQARARIHEIEVERDELQARVGRLCSERIALVKHVTKLERKEEEESKAIDDS